MEYNEFTNLPEIEDYLFGSALLIYRFRMIVNDDLGQRIGKEMERYLTKEQIEEFDKLIDTAEVADWLESNLPSYRSICRRNIRDIRLELLKYRESIPGLLDILPAGFRDLGIGEIGLSRETAELLNGYAIETVGELLDLGKFSFYGYGQDDEIRNALTRTALEEFDHVLKLGER